MEPDWLVTRHLLKGGWSRSDSDVLDSQIVALLGRAFSVMPEEESLPSEMQKSRALIKLLQAKSIARAVYLSWESSPDPVDIPQQYRTDKQLFLALEAFSSSIDLVKKGGASVDRGILPDELISRQMARLSTAGLLLSFRELCGVLDREYSKQQDLYPTWSTEDLVTAAENNQPEASKVASMLGAVLGSRLDETRLFVDPSEKSRVLREFGGSSTLH